MVVVAVLGSLAAVLLAAPRVYYAMARDGVFVRAVAAVHPRFGTPARAIAVQATLACLLVPLGSFEDIVAYFVFITVAFVALTVAGLYRLPRPPQGAYRVPGYPATPLVFLALLALLLVLLAAGRPVQAALGTAVVALGIPVYLLDRGRAPARGRGGRAPGGIADGLDQDDSLHAGGRSAAQGPRGPAQLYPKEYATRPRGRSAAPASWRPTR